MAIRATLKDVARAAGVSSASVSRAMAVKGSVSPELRARIMAAAARLDYAPNLAARALASRHAGLIAVVVSPTDDGVVVRTAAAALRRLDGHGYGVLAISETAAGHLDGTALAKRGVEAALFVGRAPRDAERAALSTRRLPWVSIADAEIEDAFCIDFGRAQALELGCRYLHEVGHRTLGVLAPAGLDLEPVMSRLMDDGIAVECSRLALRGDAAAIGGALGKLIELPGPPTAVVCADDLTALAVVRECGLRGISIPRDLAVVGFGDEPFARYCGPALTSVRPACHELGSHAAEALVGLLDGRSCVRFAPAHRLVIRQTTERPGDRRGST